MNMKDVNVVCPPLVVLKLLLSQESGGTTSLMQLDSTVELEVIGVPNLKKYHLRLAPAGII